jgi:hypothetical protein
MAAGTPLGICRGDLHRVCCWPTVHGLDLEVVILPVSDIGRAIEFYRDKVGFELNHDARTEQMHIVQVTPAPACPGRPRLACWPPSPTGNVRSSPWSPPTGPMRRSRISSSSAPTPPRHMSSGHDEARCARPRANWSSTPTRRTGPDRHTAIRLTLRNGWTRVPGGRSVRGRSPAAAGQRRLKEVHHVRSGDPRPGIRCGRGTRGA